MIYQSPGGFEATQKSYFYQPVREVDKRLAERALRGERLEPATRALWFYNPFEAACRPQWFGQWNTGRYKSHCFYAPLPSENCFGELD
jgi:N-acetylmuramoyl-L-alanine amidase